MPIVTQLTYTTGFAAVRPSKAKAAAVRVAKRIVTELSRIGVEMRRKQGKH